MFMSVTVSLCHGSIQYINKFWFWITSVNSYSKVIGVFYMVLLFMNSY
jgi:hypothetical protein